MSKNRIKFLICFAVILYSTIAFISGEAFRSIGWTTSATFTLYYLYDLFLWKFNPLEKMPKLEKKYEARYLSSHNNREEEYVWIVSVRQNLSTIKISETSKDEGKNAPSHSCCGVIFQSENKNWQICFTYLTYPNINLREKGDNMHYGTCLLDIDDNMNISGNYFTDRKTNGTVKWVSVR